MANVTKEIYLDFIRRAAKDPETRAIKVSRTICLGSIGCGRMRGRYERALEILRSEEQ